MNYKIEKIAGIDVIFAHMNDTNSVTIQIMAKAGNIYESRELNWISHFLEHLFFKWWKKYQTPKAVAEAVDNFGWEFNAYTTDYHAGYYVKCAPEFVSRAVDVLSDMMINAQFPKDELETEKWVVIQELKMYEDMPNKQVFDKWREYYYGDNSYWRSTIGTVENIQSFNQDMLFDYKEKLYTKDNLIIVVAWKIEDESGIRDQIWSNFGVLREKTSLSKPKFEKHTPSKKMDFYDKKTEQNHIIISANWINGYDDKKYICNVLTTILGWNMSSRLFQNIREKQGLCYYIGSFHMAHIDDGIFVIKAGMDKTRFDFGVEKIYEEIQNISKWYITQKELENAIWYAEWQIQMSIESSDDMASFLWTQYLLYGKIETLKDIIKNYKNVKLDDVKNIAKMLDNQNLYAYYIK